jgi:hypothetical protein
MTARGCSGSMAPTPGGPGGLDIVAAPVWSWLAVEDHRVLLTRWVEEYARSLVDPDGPWGSFAHDTVQDWLNALATAQPAADHDTPTGRGHRTPVLVILRGALLDLLATGDVKRTTAAVLQPLDSPQPTS